jgi:hypothetical protein
MNEAAISPAIEVLLVEPTPDQFERERRAFLRLLPSLLAAHRGQYVAIHNEQVVGSGPDRLKLALEVQARVRSGVYVGHVTDEPEPVRRSGIRRVLGGWRDGN